MREDLKNKIDRAIKLLKSVGSDEPVEVAYSGGKDSDVILQLVKESGIKYRAIYKNTTIDPPGTIKHCIENGVEVVRPKQSFFQLVAKKGYPSRWARFCCSELKEYKILDRCVFGVRKAESTKRANRYSEPTECRFYGSKKNHVEAIYPILDWSDDDVLEFIIDRRIKLHHLYYRDDGSIDVKRRLGCMACPLASNRKRIQQFKKYPNLVSALIKAHRIFRDTHPNAKQTKMYKSSEEQFVRDVFFDKQKDFDEAKSSIFWNDDSKGFLENYFNIKL